MYLDVGDHEGGRDTGLDNHAAGGHCRTQSRVIDQPHDYEEEDGREGQQGEMGPASADAISQPHAGHAA